MLGTLILVDDDLLMLRLLSDTLKPSGFECLGARTLQEAQRLVKRYPPLAAIVDVQLGAGESGLELVRTWRVERQFPVIVLSSQSEAIDKIIGLQMGAEDYIVKPFDPRELVLRVTRVIERFHLVAATPSTELKWDLGNQCQFDPVSRAIFQGLDRHELSTAEFNLMSYLVKNANKLLSRDQILLAVHQRAHDVNNRSVDMLIARLRKKMGLAQVEIKAIRGAGYMLSGPITTLS